MVKQTLPPTKKLPTITTQTIQLNKKTEDLDLFPHPVRPLLKLTIRQKIVALEQTQRTDRLPETDGRRDKIRSVKEMPKAIQMGMFKLQPKL